jgi:hypothetical protein
MRRRSCKQAGKSPAVCAPEMQLWVIPWRGGLRLAHSLPCLIWDAMFADPALDELVELVEPEACCEKTHPLSGAVYLLSERTGRIMGRLD